MAAPLVQKASSLLLLALCVGSQEVRLRGRGVPMSSSFLSLVGDGGNHDVMESHWRRPGFIVSAQEYGASLAACLLTHKALVCVLVAIVAACICWFSKKDMQQNERQANGLRLPLLAGPTLLGNHSQEATSPSQSEWKSEKGKSWASRPPQAGGPPHPLAPGSIPEQGQHPRRVTPAPLSFDSDDESEGKDIAAFSSRDEEEKPEPETLVAPGSIPEQGQHSRRVTPAPLSFDSDDESEGKDIAAFSSRDEEEKPEPETLVAPGSILEQGQHPRRVTPAPLSFDSDDESEGKDIAAFSSRDDSIVEKPEPETLVGQRPRRVTPALLSLGSDDESEGKDIATFSSRDDSVEEKPEPETLVAPGCIPKQGQRPRRVTPALLSLGSDDESEGQDMATFSSCDDSVEEKPEPETLVVPGCIPKQGQRPRRVTPALLSLGSDDESEGKDMATFSFHDDSVEEKPEPETLVVPGADPNKGQHRRKFAAVSLSSFSDDESEGKDIPTCSSRDDSAEENPEPGTLVPWPEYAQVTLQDQIGAGQDRTVFRAKLASGDTVAALTNVMATEHEVLRQLSRLDVDFVPRVFGYCQCRQERFLLQELAPAGDLKRLLSGPEGATWVALWGPEAVKQVAAGVSCLSRQGILHGDLACRNLLLASSGAESIPSIKVCDFGSALILATPSSEVVQEEHKISRWSSPLTYCNKLMSEREERWSLGVLAHELLTAAAQPFSKTPSLELAYRFHAIVDPDTSEEDLEEAKAWIRESFLLPPSVPMALGAVVAQCFSFRSSDRPHAEEVSQAAAECCNAHHLTATC